MSSDILYPKHYVEEATKTPKKGIVPNQNENRIRNMRQERMMGKSMSQINIQQQ